MRNKERSTSSQQKPKLEQQSQPDSLKSRVDLKQSEQPRSPQLDVSYSGDEGFVVYIGDQIRTVDELIAHAQIDLQIWDVERVVVNNYELAGKRKLGQNDAGRHAGEQLWKTGLRQIKVTLRRKAPKNVQDGIRSLIADMPRLPKPTTRKRVKGASHLVELSLYDHHVGKLCWGKASGENYNLNSAIADYAGAVEDMLERAAGFPVESIVIPLGNDLFHVDGSAGTTAKGTLVESTDDRLPKVYRAVFQVIRDAVLRCVEVAPVRIVWVPGNHDPSTSFYLCEQFRHYFEDDPHVTVDNSEETRKYLLYGVNLIGWNHGDMLSLDKLAALMPIEAKDEWSKSTYRFIRTGHYHKAKQIRHVNRDTFHGVDVRIIPSMSATDKWHYEGGYVGNLRTAECAIWNKETGHVADFTIEARSALVARRAKERGRK